MRRFALVLAFLATLIAGTSQVVAVTLVFDDFESYSLGTFPPTWVPDANAVSDPADNVVISDPTDPSNNVLKLHGRVGGTWASIVHPPTTPLPADFVVDVRVYNGSESLSGGHPERGFLELVAGTSWAVSYSPFLAVFRGAGQLAAGDFFASSQPGTDLAPYQPEQWYDLTVQYHRVGSTRFLHYWLNGIDVGGISMPITDMAAELALNNVQVGSQEGTAYFDNFTVSSVPEPSTLALLGVGAIGLAAYGLRRRHKHGSPQSQPFPAEMTLRSYRCFRRSVLVGQASFGFRRLVPTILFSLGMVVASRLRADDWTPSWTTSHLSQARENAAAASLNNKVFLGGGYNHWTGGCSNAVDIYDTTNRTWSTATLSQARYFLAAAASGNKVLFGGGSVRIGDYRDVVDIYDTSTSTWSTAALSQARDNLAAAAVGDLVFFAGGRTSSGYSDVVDIYNSTSNTWSTATLSQARGFLAATSLDDKVFFAGGQNASGYSDVVDIYDTSTSTWSTSTLSQARFSLSAAAATDQVLFAGGQFSDTELSNVVDVYHTASNTWSTAALSRDKICLSAVSSGSRLFFAGGYSNHGGFSNAVDIYNTTTNGWSTATLSQSRYGIGAASAGNQTVFAGGYNSTDQYSNAVDIYTSQDYPAITSSKPWTLVDHTTVAGLMQLNAPGSLSLGNYSLNVGSMSGNVPINLGSGRLTVVGDNTPVATYSGNISGGGGLTKNGNGTLILAGTNTYTGGTIVNQGTLQGNTLSLQGNITNNGAVVFDQSFPGVYANSISGSGSLTKMGADRLALTGSNSYTGTTNITGGTLEVDSALPAASGSQVQIGPSAALVANASIPRSILGAANSSQILANSGDVVLGDGTSYTGFSHAGTLAIGSNTLTLNSRGFANLGVLTSLAGGTLTAPNGISLGVGCNFSGSGTVNAKVAAGFGSTIEATGNLVLGNATSSVGFTSDGELYTGANTVTINDASDAVLGSLTRLGDGTSGGRLMAGTATVTGTHVNLLLDTGKNLEGRGVVTGNVKNHGHVTGDGTSLDARIVFDSPWTVSGEGTFENTMILGTFAPGNSPAIINGTNQGFGGTVQFELGGTTPGAGNGHYDQINDSASILLAGSTTLSILPWNSFVPTPGQQFEILTWQSGMNGAFGNVQVDPWFTSHGISFNVAYHNVAGTGDLTITAVPEPSSLVLLVAGAVGLAGYALRRQSVARRTGKSTALNQPRDDDSPILAFPSLSSHGRNQVRRAA